MQYIARLACVSLVSLLGIANLAFAQHDPAIQLQQEIKQQQRSSEVRPLEHSSATSPVPHLSSRPEDVPEATPVLGSPSISIESNGLLGDEQIQQIVAPYRQLSLGKQRIALLLRQLNAQLVVQGLVTSRAGIKRLDKQTNTLDIELLPGRIESYAADGLPAGQDLSHAFPSQDKNLLVLQDIEQGVHQIQRLRRYQAEVRILPGQSSDTSLVDVQLTEGESWWLQLSADNLGSQATGRVRERATVTLENALGVFDSIGLTYLRSHQSEVAIASLAVPQGYNTWSASYASSRYTQDLPAGLQEAGGSTTATLAWNRVLHLSAAGRDTAELALTHGDSWREIANITLIPNRLSVLKASFTRLRQGNGWRAWGELGISRGLPWFGAAEDSGALKSADPHAQFTKLEAHGGLIFAPSNGSGQYTGQIDAQMSTVGLYGTDQFRLGGLSSIRGYDEGAFSGDRGILFRHEWQFRPLALQAIDSQIKPLFFLDHGTARLIDGPTTRLSGAGAGVRLAAKHWGADVLVAKPLTHPSTIDANDWHVYATFRIDL